MISWLRTLEEILWPRRMKCLCCDDLSDGEYLCNACSKRLQDLHLPKWQAETDNVRSILRYDGEAKQLVLMLKTRCVDDAAQVLAEEMAAVISAWQLPPETVLTWVTMPQTRRRVRGIDHGKVLCEAVAEKTGMPVRQLLVRSNRVHTQRGLGREARLKNLSGTITCNEMIDVPVLLIDDVLTTGATVSACSEALLKAGTSEVFALTAAKVPRSTKHDQKG